MRTLEELYRIEDEHSVDLSAEIRKAKARKSVESVVQFIRADSVEVKPTDWLIQDWLARDSLAALVGPSGSYKTFVAVDASCSVATGTPFHGNAVKQGAVFILAGEGRNGLRKRIEGWSQFHRVPIIGAPLYLASQLPRLDQLTTAAIMSEVDTLVDQSRATPALIVLDTVARALAGDENSSEHMGQFIQCADWLREHFPGCTVLMVHHTGHGTQARARGSSAFYAALDSEALAKPTRSGAVELLATKCKDWSPPRPLGLRPESVLVNVPGLPGPTSTLVLVDTVLAVDHADDVRRLKSEGKTIRAIAEETGLSRSKVERTLKDLPAWEVGFHD